MNKVEEYQLELPWCSEKPKTLAGCVQDFTDYLMALPRLSGPVGPLAGACGGPSGRVPAP